MSNEQEVQQIEMSMQECKARIELSDALKRLAENADFQFVFEDTYMGKYALNSISMKASIQMMDENKQRFIDGQLAGIGHLKNYMHFVHREAEVAREALASHQDELDIMQAEEEL